MRIGQTFSQVLAPSLCAMFRLNATPHSVHTSRCLVPPLILYFLAAVWCCAIYSELADAQMPFLDIHWLAANLSVAAVAASGPSRFRFFALCNSARNLRFSSCSASKRCCCASKRCCWRCSWCCCASKRCCWRARASDVGLRAPILFVA